MSTPHPPSNPGSPDARRPISPTNLPMANPLPAGENSSLPQSRPAPRPAWKEAQPPAATLAGQSPATPGVMHSGPQPAQAANPSVSSASGMTVDDEASEEPEEFDLTQEALRAAPPWLVSLVVHMLLLILLALLTIPLLRNKKTEVELSLASPELGDQLLNPDLDLGSLDPLEIAEPVLSEDILPAEDPLAAIPEILPLTDTGPKPVEIEAPSIGKALSGREPGQKKSLLAAYGGNRQTEEAVQLGLAWLKKNQLKDGLWSLNGPYQDGVIGIENKTAATAMALLAFQGNGNTHKRGEYKEEVARGMQALLKRLDADGRFSHEGPQKHTLYTQAQATIALVELYGMTKDKSLRDKAQETINYAISHQAREGGWRYQPGFDTDTSVTGWFVMALQSGLMAGLEVPQESLNKISSYLDKVADPQGSHYAYQTNKDPVTSMTAEALLCRQYLGWKRDDPRLAAGIRHLLDNPIDYEEDMNVYYWYYATQAMHHYEGDAWRRWNNVMRREVPSRQVKTGPETGSWKPHDDRWGAHAGRLYTTCLSIYMLEVYYRHLPIYSYRAK